MKDAPRPYRGAAASGEKAKPTKHYSKQSAATHKTNGTAPANLETQFQLKVQNGMHIFFAKFRFDTAENESAKKLQILCGARVVEGQVNNVES